MGKENSIIEAYAHFVANRKPFKLGSNKEFNKFRKQWKKNKKKRL